MSTSHLSVLFADITGSTRLYEEHGDDAARSAVAECIEVLTGQMARFHGRLVKSIGDEIMCVFESPDQSVMAANEMQLAVRSAGEAGRFVTGPLQIKIGIHFGPGVEREADVFGEAALIAQQVIKQAKADQILASAETVNALPPALRFGNRRFDRIESEGREAPVDIVELIWEVSDLTQMADTQPIRIEPEFVRLLLRYQGVELELNNTRPQVTLGRTDQNDLVVPTQLASRSHAVVEYRRGRFQLRDISSNGTVLVDAEGEAHLLRGETVQLSGQGTFCLGGAPKTILTGSWSTVASDTVADAEPDRERAKLSTKLTSRPYQIAPGFQQGNFSIRPCTVARGCWTPTRASSTVAVHGEGQNHPRSDGQRR